MESDESRNWNEAGKTRYRLDLRMGIPQSKIPGTLEGWVGDCGLCCDPDHHPYLVLAEIASRGGVDQENIMRAVASSAETSGPIQVSVGPVPGAMPGTESTSYEIKPSPGLHSFILMLSRNCPLITPPGSVSEYISQEITDPITIVSPATDTDSYSHTHAVQKKRDQRSKGVMGAKDGEIIKYDRQGDSEPVLIEIFRIVLRRDGLPVAEYDLWQRRWLPAQKSILRRNARLSLRKYRVGRGYQMTEAQYSDDPRIYIISDLHLGHANSIPKYKRPFLHSDPGEMDRVLIRNWNWTIKKSDTVIFLGDMSFMSAEPIESYLERLQGSIFYLEGNHDPYYPYMSHCLLMRYRGVPYLFIHDPKELTRPFDGWVIHGHVHNKDLAKYPFFNPDTRMVNVSAELIGYRPISLDEIHSLVCGTDEIIKFRDRPVPGLEPGDVPPVFT